MIFNAEKWQILQSLRRLFIILVGLTTTWFSEKMHTWFDAQLDQKIVDSLYSGYLQTFFHIFLNLHQFTKLLAEAPPSYFMDSQKWLVFKVFVSYFFLSSIMSLLCIVPDLFLLYFHLFPSFISFVTYNWIKIQWKKPERNNWKHETEDYILSVH